jgi:hypothetical protein
LTWATQPTAVASLSSAAASSTTKYELQEDELTSDVTLDNVMYSLASHLFYRGPDFLIEGVEKYYDVQQIHVYNSEQTKVKYNAKRQEFAAQGASTAGTWVFHGTPCTANVHSIMTEGFKVCTCVVSYLRELCIGVLACCAMRGIGASAAVVSSCRSE